MSWSGWWTPAWLRPLHRSFRNCSKSASTTSAIRPRSESGVPINGSSESRINAAICALISQSINHVAERPSLVLQTFSCRAACPAAAFQRANTIVSRQRKGELSGPHQRATTRQLGHSLPPSKVVRPYLLYPINRLHAQSLEIGWKSDSDNRFRGVARSDMENQGLVFFRGALNMKNQLKGNSRASRLRSSSGEGGHPKQVP